MKVSQLLPIALWSIPGAVATLEWNGKQCEWYGWAPNCGTVGTAMNEMDRDSKGNPRNLVITTEHQNKETACEKLGFEPVYVKYGFLTVKGQNRCEDEYGSGCTFGYKRLWCDLS